MLLYLILTLLLPIQEKTIYNFDKKKEIKDWQIVNDGVMGGLSQSRIDQKKEGIMRYMGFVSLENYGGFASTRTVPQNFSLDGYTGMTIRLKGDGKRYKFRIRTNSNFDGIAYSIDLVTEKGVWQDHSFQFSDMIATFRGRTFPDYAPIDARDIRQLGILIADKQEGNFELELDWIKATK